MPFVGTSRRFTREREALAQDCGAYAMKYGRIWFPVVHGSRKCMDTVVETCEKQCRDGEDSRKMRMVRPSKEKARLAGKKDCDRQPSFVNAGNTHAGVSASNCVCYVGTCMCWRDTRVMENESRKISRHTLELRDD